MIYVYISTVLIPLASDVMHEFHETEWNVHFFYLCERQEVVPSPTRKKANAGVAICYGVLRNLSGGQPNESVTETLIDVDGRLDSRMAMFVISVPL